MSASEGIRRSWMAYELPLTHELQLEAEIRAVTGHPDGQKVRDLCASLMRQNFHQKQLLSRAIGRVGELELVLLLGATAEPDETDLFLEMAREVCADLGIA